MTWLHMWLEQPEAHPRRARSWDIRNFISLTSIRKKRLRINGHVKGLYRYGRISGYVKDLYKYINRHVWTGTVGRHAL